MNIGDVFNGIDEMAREMFVAMITTTSLARRTAKQYTATDASRKTFVRMEVCSAKSRDSAATCLR